MTGVDARIDNRDRNAAAIEDSRCGYQSAEQCVGLLAHGRGSGRCFNVTKHGDWPIW